MVDSTLVRLHCGEHVAFPTLRVASARDVGSGEGGRWLLALGSAREGEAEEGRGFVDAMLTPDASGGVPGGVRVGATVRLTDYVVERREGLGGSRTMLVVLGLEVVAERRRCTGEVETEEEAEAAAAAAAREEAEAAGAGAVCGVCLELMVAPVSVACGHNFCAGCLGRVVGSGGGGGANCASCPSCRSSLKYLKADRAGGFPVNTMLRDLIRERFPSAWARRHEALRVEAEGRRRRAEREAEARARGGRLGALLVEAAGRGDGGEVDKLLAEGADINFMVVVDDEGDGGEVCEGKGEGEVREGEVCEGAGPRCLGLRTAYTAAVEGGHAEVARALVARGGSEEPLALLVAGALAPGNPRYVRREALEALEVLGAGRARGQIGRVVECLGRALEQDHDSVAVAALRALGALADDEASVLAALPAVRSVLDASLNAGSTWAAGPGYNHEVEGSVLRASLACLEKLDAAVGDVVATCYNWLGGNLPQILRSLLGEAEVGRDSWDWETQVACLKLISRLHHMPDELTLCTVAACMGQSDDAAVREAAFQCLRRIGEERGPGSLDRVYGEVARQVDDYHYKVRRNASIILGTRGGEAPLRRVGLLTGLADEDSEVRVACAQSIAALLEEASAGSPGEVSEYVRGLALKVALDGSPARPSATAGGGDAGGGFPPALAAAMLGGTALVEWVNQGRGPAHALALLGEVLGRPHWKGLIGYLTHPAVLAEAPESCLLSLSALQSPEACGMAVPPLARLVAGRGEGRAPVSDRVRRVAIQALADVSLGASGLPRRAPAAAPGPERSSRRSAAGGRSRSGGPAAARLLAESRHRYGARGGLDSSDSSDVSSDEVDESSSESSSSVSSMSTAYVDADGEEGDAYDDDRLLTDVGPIRGHATGPASRHLIRRATEARMTYLRERRMS